MPKQFSFKGDGASQETVAFGNTFPVDRFVTPSGLTPAQEQLLLGHPMFESRDEPAPEPEPAIEPEAPVVEPVVEQPAPEPEVPAKGGK